MQAMMGEDTKNYTEAMKREIDQLENKGTWTLVKWNTLPSDTNILPGTWVFKQGHPQQYNMKIKSKILHSWRQTN